MGLLAAVVRDVARRPGASGRSAQSAGAPAPTCAVHPPSGRTHRLNYQYGVKEARQRQRRRGGRGGAHGTLRDLWHRFQHRAQDQGKPANGLQGFVGAWGEREQCGWPCGPPSARSDTRTRARIAAASRGLRRHAPSCTPALRRRRRCRPTCPCRPRHWTPPPLARGQALDKVIALVDPGDDTYTTQRALVDGDAAFYLTELLADASVAPRAAEAVAALTAHSAAARARLAAGPLMGLDSSVERVSLNPCQAGALGGWAGTGRCRVDACQRGPAAAVRAERLDACDQATTSQHPAPPTTARLCGLRGGGGAGAAAAGAPGGGARGGGRGAGRAVQLPPGGQAGAAGSAGGDAAASARRGGAGARERGGLPANAWAVRAAHVRCAGVLPPRYHQGCRCCCCCCTAVQACSPQTPTHPPTNIRHQIFELLDALLDGMECGGDEAGQQLELLRPQLLAALRARAPGGAAAPLASLSLLATLCERRPDAVEALLEGGAAAAAAQHLLHGARGVLPCSHEHKRLVVAAGVRSQLRSPATRSPPRSPLLLSLPQAGRWCRTPRRARCGACSRGGAGGWRRRGRPCWAARPRSWRRHWCS